MANWLGARGDDCTASVAMLLPARRRRSGRAMPAQPSVPTWKAAMFEADRDTEEDSGSVLATTQAAENLCDHETDAGDNTQAHEAAHRSMEEEILSGFKGDAGDVDDDDDDDVDLSMYELDETTKPEYDAAENVESRPESAPNSLASAWLPETSSLDVADQLVLPAIGETVHARYSAHGDWKLARVCCPPGNWRQAKLDEQAGTLHVRFEGYSDTVSVPAGRWARLPGSRAAHEYPASAARELLTSDVSVRVTAAAPQRDGAALLSRWDPSISETQPLDAAAVDASRSRARDADLVASRPTSRRRVELQTTRGVEHPAARRVEHSDRLGELCGLSSEERRMLAECAQSAHAHSSMAPVPGSPIDETNPGHKLLRLMGWRPGEGLGTHGEGQLKPASDTLQAQTTRAGLGSQRSR